ncbi:unannotated protein [freshwater metagenome]|uniref:Unannotated protein n=1 Tax=freshwater metagenome TaxID=449393 RepID=A0A6J7R868_9ZZZZ
MSPRIPRSSRPSRSSSPAARRRTRFRRWWRCGVRCTCRWPSSRRSTPSSAGWGWWSLRTRAMPGPARCASESTAAARKWRRRVRRLAQRALRPISTGRWLASVGCAWWCTAWACGRAMSRRRRARPTRHWPGGGCRCPSAHGWSTGSTARASSSTSTASIGTTLSMRSMAWCSRSTTCRCRAGWVPRRGRRAGPSRTSTRPRSYARGCSTSGSASVARGGSRRSRTCSQ